MNRRSIVTRLGTLTTVGLAGCLADGPGSGQSPGADDAATDTPAGTDDGTETPEDGQSDTATETDCRCDGTPAGGQTPPHDAPFPPGRGDVDDVVWFREVSKPDESLFLEHSASTVSLPDAALSFTLRNNTERRFMTNFYDWALYRWESGQWHRVAPHEVPEPLMSLAPGESHRWSLRLHNDALSDPIHRSQGTDDVSVAAVGGGSYAFAAQGWWENQEETPTYEHKTVCAARFTVDGDPLSLVPSDVVTGTSREDDTVIVEADNPYSDDGDEDGEPATYVLTRDDDTSDPETVITEQVYRQWPLRDALAYADETVEEVRVETVTNSRPPFGVHADRTLPVTYDGRTYRISVADDDG